MFTRAYGEGALFPMSALDAEGSPAGLVLETGMTFAAADLVLRSDEIAATLTAESVAFTSGSTKPSVGDTLTGATSAATAVVIGVVLTSGTWSGADAAGTLFVEQVSGTFQSENLNNTTDSASNVMAIGGDITGVAAEIINKGVWVALTSTEMACQYGNVEVVDATGTEVWLEFTFAFETYGNASALHPVAEVNLADDAITAGKYDQSTAFPMADADGTALTEAGGTGDHLTAILSNQTLLNAFAGAIISGAAATGTLSTTVATTDLTGYADSELVGRTIIFTGGTANGQSGRITAYANTNGQVTYTTLATAPVDGDTFIIL